MKKTIKVRKLRGWVKVALYCIGTVAIIGICLMMINEGLNRLDDMYNQCDDARGYACDYYQARQYALKGE